MKCRGFYPAFHFPIADAFSEPQRARLIEFHGTCFTCWKMWLLPSDDFQDLIIVSWTLTCYLVLVIGRMKIAFCLLSCKPMFFYIKCPGGLFSSAVTYADTPSNSQWWYVVDYYLSKHLAQCVAPGMLIIMLPRQFLLSEKGFFSGRAFILLLHSRSSYLLCSDLVTWRKSCLQIHFLVSLSCIFGWKKRREVEDVSIYTTRAPAGAIAFESQLADSRDNGKNEGRSTSCLSFQYVASQRYFPMYECSNVILNYCM